jgi:metal-responsive CopG/Arc/MetJ family transcriptional regulator
MLRTIISLDKNDIKWLDKYSKQKKISRTKIVHVAIKNYRQKIDDHSDSKKLLNQTSGLLINQNRSVSLHQRISH